MNQELDVEFNDFNIHSDNKYIDFAVGILFISIGFFVFIIIKMAVKN